MNQISEGLCRIIAGVFLRERRGIKLGGCCYNGDWRLFSDAVDINRCDTPPVKSLTL